MCKIIRTYNRRLSMCFTKLIRLKSVLPFILTSKAQNYNTTASKWEIQYSECLL